ncbi:hypothetical protein [Chondromyces apiculatus]|uniref:Uncharacterized protein n=1 Tax=Chondromyces apiculatus DSM 436 TaxID=1192034 RepID=A0A017TDK6_9BACT|nr:hypothetical protein [Chondromyces apiculatus]EYF06676.1 Hypothetical protein CAP_1806 [Chondromyces apiculatus DSM 436]
MAEHKLHKAWDRELAPTFCPDTLLVYKALNPHQALSISARMSLKVLI